MEVYPGAPVQVVVWQARDGPTAVTCHDAAPTAVTRAQVDSGAFADGATSRSPRQAVAGLNGKVTSSNVPGPVDAPGRRTPEPLR